MGGLRQIPWRIGERRPLAIDAGRIAPKHLTEGNAPTVEAELVSPPSAGSNSRRYRLLVGGKTRGRVQLNHPDASGADDGERLAREAEALLSPPPEPPARLSASADGQEGATPGEVAAWYGREINN